MRLIQLSLLIFATTLHLSSIAESSTNYSKNSIDAWMLNQTFTDLNGIEHRLTDWPNKIVVVNFWASWCPACVDEISDLNTLQTEFTSVQFIGISIEASKETNKFLLLSDNETNYPVLIGEKKGLNLSYRFGNKKQIIPFTVVINHKGKIIKQITGRINKAELAEFLSEQKQ